MSVAHTTPHDVTSHASTETTSDVGNTSLFVAVDGTSGFVWNNLTAAHVDAVTATAQQDVTVARNTHVGDTTECVPIAVHLQDATVGFVRTTSDGLIRMWVNTTTSPPQLVVDTHLGAGFHVAALMTRLVATLGLPNAEDSNAAA